MEPNTKSDKSIIMCSRSHLLGAVHKLRHISRGEGGRTSVTVCDVGGGGRGGQNSVMSQKLH